MHFSVPHDASEGGTAEAGSYSEMLGGETSRNAISGVDGYGASSSVTRALTRPTASARSADRSLTRTA